MTTQMVTQESGAIAPAGGAKVSLTRKDFVSNQEVKWCPGCGDYAVLAQVQRVLPEIGVAKENIVFISGIGCSSRFPYYMSTYGMHSIHGRAPAIATGLSLGRPELSIWVITGDGDALSIGGNHVIHAMRRNVDLRILMFNNRIYGLTKGQVSPTSEQGKITKTTPLGSVDRPFEPALLALGAGATFIARCIDTEAAQLSGVLRRAAQHRGTAYIEILQNCPVFNDGSHDYLTDKAAKADRLLALEHGKPLLFGKDKNKGIRIGPSLKPEVVTVGSGEGEVPLEAVMVHDETNEALANILGRLAGPDFPTPTGILRAVRAPTLGEMVAEQEKRAIATKGAGTLESLLHAGETWTVAATPQGAGDEEAPEELGVGAD
jgi:2-oxoglutarate ferredoxin oxidoreductase subunit beta